MIVIFFFSSYAVDRIKMGSTDYGNLGNGIIETVAMLFHFPTNILFEPSSGYVILIGVLINIALYSLLLYYLIKFVLNRIRGNGSGRPVW